MFDWVLNTSQMNIRGIKIKGTVRNISTCNCHEEVDRIYESHCCVCECVTAVYVNPRILSCPMFLVNASLVQSYCFT